MKKYLILLFGIALGLLIGVFGILFWEEKTKSNSDNNTEEADMLVEETSENVISEKMVEEMTSLYNNSSYLSQYVEFREKGKRINERSFKVFDVLSNSQALVHGKDEYGHYNGVVYLLLDKADSDMYDDQIIEVPKGKVVKRHGT